ncbi:MAG: hypothetical protein N2652_07500 [Kiritimatiellae bacterium]|nr:hypothetical protein [Kiritimatiellia bacterium]
MAEALFRLRSGPRSDWTAASAGLAAARGHPPSSASIEVMRELGVDISGHRTRPLTAELVERAAWIITMTGAQAAEITERFPGVTGRVRRLGSFRVGDAGDIPDPLGGPVESYRQVRDEIDRCVMDLVLTLRDADPATHRGERTSA